MKTKLFHISPLSIDMKLGRELNAHIECFPKDSWIMVTDRDTMFLGDNYAKIIYEAIEDNPNAALMTCRTNRISNPEQCYLGTLDNSTDIVSHYNISSVIEQEPKKYVELGNKHIAAMMWLFPRSTWERNKFDDFSIVDRKMSFDIRWTRLIVGQKVLINRLYIYHYYRLHKSAKDYRHIVR